MGIAILIRHGESESNVRNLITSDFEGFPLTETGRSQALKASEQLTGLRIDSIHTSPVQRARETADIISRTIEMSPFLDERIRESGMGQYNNKSLNEVPKLRRSELGMESWESHQERFISALKEVKGVSIMVSHAFPIRSALAYYLQLSEDESYGINIRNASISVLDLEEGEILCIGSRYLTSRVKDHIANGGL